MQERPTRLCGDAEIVDYLRKVHDIILAGKTSRNLRAAGKGPRVHYFGARVYTTPDDVDRWVAERITTERRRRRARSEFASGAAV